MKTVIRLVAAAFVALLVVHPPGIASPSLQGTYTLDPRASQDIGKAVDAVVAQLSFLVRSTARQRLMAANPLLSRIVITFAGQNVTIRSGDGAAITTPTDGTPVDWTQEDGDETKISTVWAGAKLKRSVVAPNGTRINTYGLDPPGKTLTLEVVVQSSQLPQDVVYKLVFRRGS